MAWVVDTCLLIDVVEDDPAFFTTSATLLDARRGEGLVVCPVSVVELAPVFEGSLADTKMFLDQTGIDCFQVWNDADTEAAFDAWSEYVKKKRDGKLAKRPMTDVLIGAFAQRFDGLLTRNASDFRSLFPNLNIVEP